MEVTRRGFIQGVGAAFLLTVVKPDEVRKFLDEEAPEGGIDAGSELWFPLEFDAYDVELLAVQVNGMPLKEGVHYTATTDNKGHVHVEITHCPDDALDARKDLFRVEVSDLAVDYKFTTGMDFIPKAPQPKARARKNRRAIRRRGVC